MAEENKTTLFYILALIGLIISSVLFTGRIESPVEEPLLAPAPPAFAEVKSTLNLPEVDQKACPVMSQKTAFYKIEPNRLVDRRLIISGTIYASDFITPVPDVRVEIWQAPAEISPDPPEALHYTFYGWVRTDAAGHYETTTLMPGQGNILPLYYRVRYQNHCPLGLQLFLVDDRSRLTDSSLISTLAKLGLAREELAGPLLRRSVDIVLPVPLPPLHPPSPEAIGSAARMPPTQSITWGPSYYADDANLEVARNRPELEFMKRIDLKVLRGVAEGSAYHP